MSAAVQAPPQVQISGLVKRYGDTLAVAGVDLEIGQGEIYGLVGPNGAGKTTLLSMATGLLRPDAGTATVCGVDMWTDPVQAKRLLGVLPDGMAIFDRLTGTQLVTYAGLLRGMDRETVASRTADLMGVLDLREAADTLVLVVKPQDMGGLVEEIGDHVSAGNLVVSLAAGIPTQYLESRLPAGVAVVRVSVTLNCLLSPAAPKERIEGDTVARNPGTVIDPRYRPGVSAVTVRVMVLAPTRAPSAIEAWL